MQIKTIIPGSVVYEVKKYRYTAASRTLAEIEILAFEKNQYGVQAKILETGEEFSTGKSYETIQQAVQDIVLQLEDKISNSEWVKKIFKFEENREKQ